MHQHIFNRKLLKTRLAHLDTTNSDDITKMKKIVSLWKYSIESRDLDKTKEEAIKGRFLNDFFVEILGYKSMLGNSLWNMNVEQKSNVDTTKSDAALGYFTTDSQDVRVVIEIKDAKTDLDKKQQGRTLKVSPVEQAFSYASKSGRRCNWVIVSNFREIRLYRSNDQSTYEKFVVAELLDEGELKRLRFMLSCANLIDLTEKSMLDALYEENEAEKVSISKLFYKDYKETRLALFKHVKERNEGKDEILLFEKSQKLLDRFIFICFCEDSGLLPDNVFRRVIEVARSSFDLTETRIWEQLKALFVSIDKGNRGRNINKFNGGLFKEDPQLDELIMTDEIFPLLENISGYDFESDLNVNILGHIFEQSIKDIEEIKADINGVGSDKDKSKRKQDGIYYTPEYITRYIVEQTIGTWLDLKKEELGENDLPPVPEESDNPVEKGRRTRIINRHIKYWEAYRACLSSIRVLDPACGSGAFLNQAFDYLVAEGQRVNHQLARLHAGQTFYLFDLGKHILKNNLFGVDLNAESVEITKLALWLKTANVQDELTSLDENIKCGNSLIEDDDYAGSSAFIWTDQFPQIMNEGGFDVVIGNPPWGAELTKHQCQYVRNIYMCKSGEVESYAYFIELCLEKLVKKDGLVGLITPNTWLYLDKFLPLRSEILDKYTFIDLVELEKNIFEDVPDIVPVIFVIKNDLPFSQGYDLVTQKLIPKNRIDFLIDDSKFIATTVNTSSWKQILWNPFNLLLSSDVLQVLVTMDKHSKIRENDKVLVRYGIKTGNNKKYVSKKPQTDGNWVRCLAAASGLKQYAVCWEHDYLNFGRNLSGYSERSFEMPKIIIQYIRKLSLTQRLICAIDRSGDYYPLNNFSFIESPDTDELYFLLGLLNSNLMNFYFKNVFIDYNIKPKYIDELPIPSIDVQEKQLFVSHVKSLVNLSTRMYEQALKAREYLENVHQINNLPVRTKNILDLDINSIITKNKDINERTKFELVGLVDELQKKNQQIQLDIANSHKSVNDHVYQLFGLTASEISTVNLSEWADRDE